MMSTGYKVFATVQVVNGEIVIDLGDTTHYMTLTTKSGITCIVERKSQEFFGFTEVEKMIRKGDKVIMNGKYYVSEKNKDKEFIVTTEPTEVCGTLSVWLEGFRGCYAVDGLTKVGSLN